MACVSKVNPIVSRSSKIIKGFNPSITPVITSLSFYSYYANTYGELTINGLRFFPNGITYVQFGNENVDVIYNSSSSIVIQLPINQTTLNNSTQSSYTVSIRVVNIESKFHQPPMSFFSNSVDFEIIT